MGIILPGSVSIVFLYIALADGPILNDPLTVLDML